MNAARNPLSRTIAMRRRVGFVGLASVVAVFTTMSWSGAAIDPRDSTRARSDAAAPAPDAIMATRIGGPVAPGAATTIVPKDGSDGGEGPDGRLPVIPDLPTDPLVVEITPTTTEVPSTTASPTTTTPATTPPPTTLPLGAPGIPGPGPKGAGPTAAAAVSVAPAPTAPIAPVLSLAPTAEPAEAAPAAVAVLAGSADYAVPLDQPAPMDQPDPGAKRSSREQDSDETGALGAMSAVGAMGAPAAEALTAFGGAAGTSGVRIQNFVRGDVSGAGGVHVYDYQAGSPIDLPSTVAFAATGSSFSQTTSGSTGVALSAPYGDGPADVSVQAWWNTAYRTRRCFVVTNPTAQPTQNQPASMVFNATADLTAGRLAAGASDLRATTGGASPVPLSFFAAGPWTTSTTASTINVRIPSLAAGASTTVCLYYGNAAAGASPSAAQYARRFPLYRINNGGAATNDTLEPTDTARQWQSNTAGGGASSGTGPGGTWSLSAGYSYGPVTVTPLTTGPNAIPSDVPTSMLQDENYAPWNITGGCSNGTIWDQAFTLASNKPAEIRWYSAELFQNAAGARRFHVDVNGVRQLTNFDPWTATGTTAGSRKAGMWSWTVGPGGTIAGASPLLVRDTCTGPDSPGMVAIEVLDNTTFGVTGGSTSESLLATSGTWMTAPLDAGATGTGIWGAVDATVTVPAGAGLSFQVRWASTSAGLSAAAWTGPDGTATTWYTVGTPVPLPYAVDGSRFAQLRYQLTGNGVVGPTIGTVRLRSQLPELTRVAAGSFATVVAVTAATPSAGWLVRIKASDASLIGKATSIVEPVIVSGGPNLTAAQLRIEDRTATSWCCGPTQLQITAGAVTAPPPAPTGTVPGADASRSVRLDVQAAAAATTSVMTATVKLALSATVSLELPIRVQIQT